jgi:hypothetical protein
MPINARKQRTSLAFPEVRSISLRDNLVVGEVSNEQECNGLLRRLLLYPK